MTVYRKELTADQVRSLLDYYPETGEFIWKMRIGTVFEVSKFNAIHAGQPAGHLDARGYRRLKIFGDYHAGHRIAWLWMTGEWPPEDIDHINCNKSDNRFSNLRLANRSQNIANQGARADNKLGLKGVCFKPKSRGSRHYHAQIKKDGKVYSLGYFATAEEGHAAYVAAAAEKHGEFARTA